MGGLDVVTDGECGRLVEPEDVDALAAGFLAMWAVISEYPLAPIGVLLAARAFSGRLPGNSKRALPRFGPPS